MQALRVATMGLGLVLGSLAMPAMGQGMGSSGMGHGMGQGMGGGLRVVTALCGNEIAARCATVERGPALRACLESGQQNLGESCRLALEATGPNRGPGSGPVARLCMVELDKFCSGVEHGGGLARDCLEKRKSELGESCTIALDNTGRGGRR